MLDTQPEGELELQNVSSDSEGMHTEQHNQQDDKHKFEWFYERGYDKNFQFENKMKTDKAFQVQCLLCDKCL